MITELSLNLQFHERDQLTTHKTVNQMMFIDQFYMHSREQITGLYLAVKGLEWLRVFIPNSLEPLGFSRVHFGQSGRVHSRMGLIPLPSQKWAKGLINMLPWGNHCISLELF